MPLQTADRDEMRERLIDIAIEVVEARGSQALTPAELAARAGIAQATIGRYFEDHDALIEACAERWFRPKVAIMEEVLASDLPARRKMYEFYARRFTMMRDSYYADPTVFQMYCELGLRHFEVTRSYVDLGDHYLGMIIGEAMSEGYFVGLEVDEAISLVNQMIAPYVNITLMAMVIDKLNTSKIARIVDAIFDGLSAADRGAAGLTGLRAA